MKRCIMYILLLTGVLLFTGRPVLAAGACVTAACHAGIAAAPAAHEPVRAGECSACHTPRNQAHPSREKGFELKKQGAALCSECHEGMGKKPVQHQPFKEGACTSCHKPHGGKERFLLDVGSDRNSLCFSCHDKAPFEQRIMHGPAVSGSCSACHDPHESTEKSLLKGKAKDFCSKCHAEFFEEMKKSAVVHGPVSTDSCTTCHNPHGTAAAMLLKKESPDLCVACHKKIGSVMSGSKVLHKPLLQEGGCTSCHAPHYSPFKKLLRSDELTFCLSCHGTDVLGSPPLKNIKKQLEGKKNLHGPIKLGSCTACHDPHGSSNFRLLKGSYPAGLYVTYQDGLYGACLNCHEKNMLRFKDTTIYTKFRNGNRNLHYVHVAGRKGRSCRICHEPHASDGEKLINKKSMKFGDWDIPINLNMTGTGGSCAPGCHRPLKYDRNKPVSYAPDSR